MNSPVTECDGDLWAKAFAEAKFPAFLLDDRSQVIRANREGQAWISQSRPLPAVSSRKDDLRMGTVLELPPSDDVPAAVCMRQADGTTLLCLATDGPEHVREFVRLFNIAMVLRETVCMKDERLEVYHELFTHDAPNYLTAIYGYLQIMQGQELPREKTQKYIDTSVRQVEALNHLIDTTRSIRQMEIVPRTVVVLMDLGALVSRAILSAQESSKGKTAEIRNQVPLGVHKVMTEDQLEEVFRIILDNAIAYSDHPIVSVSIEDAGPCWNLRFTDNARGIPDDKKEFLFLRFHRLDKQRKIRGSGLSLSLAKVLVERQGGRIWVENAVPGDHTKGSTFIVALPKA